MLSAQFVHYVNLLNLNLLQSILNTGNALVIQDLRTSDWCFLTGGWGSQVYLPSCYGGCGYLLVLFTLVSAIGYQVTQTGTYSVLIV